MMTAFYDDNLPRGGTFHKVFKMNMGQSRDYKIVQGAQQADIVRYLSAQADR